MFSKEESDIVIRAKNTLKELLQKDSFYMYSSKTYLKDSYVSGGAIASLLRGENPNDIDVYFRDDVNRENMEQHLLLNKDKLTDTTTFLLGKSGSSVYALTVADSRVSYIVKNKSGKPEEVKSSFDFIHCMAHYCFSSDKLYISKDTYDAAMNKWLIINPKSGYTKGKLYQWRLNKLLSQGYSWKQEYNS